MSSPARARTSKGGGRFYTWDVHGRTERYWSVTTILKALPKDALKWWAAKSVAEFAYDEASNWLGMTRSRAVDYLKREPFRWTGERADVGTAVHAIAEAIALGKPAPRFDTPEERAYVAAVLDWHRELTPRFLVTEASVYHRTQKYAGTLDAIVDIPLAALDAYGAHPWAPRPGRDAVTLLVDYKTGGNVDEGKGVYPEVALQLNAYAGAEFIGAPDGTEPELPTLDGLAVVHLGTTGWRLVPVRYDPDLFRTFLYVREVFRFLEVTSKDALGAALVHTYPDPRNDPDGGIQ